MGGVGLRGTAPWADMADEELLVPLEKYLAASVHIGTKFRTKSMAEFVYKINPAGLAILNVQKIDQRISLVAKFLSKFKPEDIVVVCRRENGWKAAKKFASLIGTKCFTGRYPAGVLTNPKLDTFMEAKLMFVVDPWPDKNAVHDAIQIGMPVVAFCDSNNTTNNIDVVLPCNNKNPKSLGLIFWILTNQILREKGILPADKEIDIPLSEFTGE